MRGVGTKTERTTNKAGMKNITELHTAYKLRWKRRRLLFRAFRKRTQIQTIQDQTKRISPDSILVFATVRNEIERIPYFLKHYRALGVDHFLIVNNGSDDGTVAHLKDQPDVSLWSTTESYRLSRFGMDWLTWLMSQYGHGHWCLTVDADELFIYPNWKTRPLSALTEWLETSEQNSMAAMMLDLYPQGPVGNGTLNPESDPTEQLTHFDSGNYTITYQPKHKNLWIQGGVRARQFFDQDPRRAPTLNKIPLIKWHWRYAYLNSTHAALPPRLNKVYETEGGEKTCGVLLHTKFLPTIVFKSEVEQTRKEHFENSDLYNDYYLGLTRNPVLWTHASRRLGGWRQLKALGLMSRGGWV